MQDEIRQSALGEPTEADTADELAEEESPEPEEHYARGVVKFFKHDKGYGGITSPDVPNDV